MKQLVSLFIACLFYVLTCGYCSAQNVVHDYQPKIVEPLTQAWLWNEVEPLRGKGFRTMVQAPDGVILFGTETGIYGYDGYELTHFGPEDGIEQQAVYEMYASKSGHVYVINRDGIYSFDGDRWRQVYKLRFSGLIHNSFAEDATGTVWLRIPQGIVRISGDKPTLVLEISKRLAIGLAADRQDRLWVTMEDAGAIYVCPLAKLKQVTDDPLDLSICSTELPKNIASDSTHKFRPFVDAQGDIWVIDKYPDSGIFQYRAATNTWIEHPIRQILSSVVETFDGTIVFGSNNGLYQYKDGQWMHIDHQRFRQNLSNIFVYESRDHKLWVGTLSGRVYSLDRTREQFQEFSGMVYQDDDRNGNQWFISAQEEIISYNKGSQKWWVHHDPTNIIDTPVLIHVARNGHVFVVGSDGLDAAFSRYDGNQWKKYVTHDFASTIFYRAFFEDVDGNFYMGNGQNLRGSSARYKGGFIRFTFDQNDQWVSEHFKPPQVPFVISDFMQSENKTLWLVSRQLFRFDGHAALEVQMPDNYRAEESNHIAMAQDIIWIASFGRGLHRFDGSEWRFFPKEHTTGSSPAVFIHPTKDGRLYAMTFQGVVYFDGQVWNRHFLPEPFYMMRKSGNMKIDSDGSLWFNYAIAFWYERALGFKDKKGTQYTKIRSVKYRPDQDPPRLRIMEYSEKVAALGKQFIRWQGYDKWNQTTAEHLLYRYRVDDQEWSSYQNNTNITLDNLKHGTHSLELTVRDAVGNVSPSSTRVSFTVQAPLWLQPWFVVLMASLFAAIVGLIAYIIREREKHLLILNKIRLEFYTHVTHELRTPLTIILGPLEKLKKIANTPEQVKLIDLAYNSSLRLKQLVDQILQIRRLDAGQEEMHFDIGDPIEFVNGIFMSFKPLAQNKNVALQITADVSLHIHKYDKDKIQKIADNLITNAIKYTQPGGEVNLVVSIKDVDEEKSSLEIEIADNGPGISAQIQQKIFSDFYRASKMLSEDGFGIGLAYVKQLVDLMEGEIHLTSPTDVDSNRGTTFHVVVPLSRVVTENKLFELDKGREGIRILNTDEEKPLLLVIEDNREIREILKFSLDEYFQIIEAENGETGIDAAQANIPDIIISDVMMPEIDGFECCRRLKRHEATCHIPVILLTALGERNYALEGLEVGADEYIAKPIDVEFLIARLNNLLENRKRIQQQFNANPKASLETAALNETDNFFLQRMEALLEEQFDDPELDITELAKKLGFSRATFYRKIKALTGNTPAHIIRSYRLRKAAEMLKSGAYSVSEVLVNVGFQDSSYFSKSFKEKYGCSPSKYMTMSGN